MVFRKPNFGPPPDGYIAGLGRGATGFITRGDIGPAKIGESTFSGQSIGMAGPPGLSAPPGLAAPQKPPQPNAPPRDPKEDYSDANFDEWNGYGGSLFTGIKEDAEDREADQTFAKVEDYLDGRRKKKREEKAKELNLKYASEKVDYTAKFSDLKTILKDVSREQWEALPDAQDLVKQNKKKRADSQRYTPVPDSVLASAR